MLKIFVPDLYIENYTKLNIAYLKQRNIKLLVCDIDNTLVPFDQHYPDEGVFAFIKELKDNDITLVLISNNKLERVERFAKELHVRCYPSAHKPLKKTYLQVLKDHGLKADQVASIGDQLLTDVLGSKRCHILTILAQPLVKRDIKYTKINRFIEKGVYYLLERFDLLKRGEFSDDM